MKRMKKKMTLLLAVLCLMTTALAGCSSGKEDTTAAKSESETTSAASADDLAAVLENMDPITLKLGHNLNADAVGAKSCVYWADLVKEKTNGKVIIEVYDNSTLGSQRDMLEGLKIGTIDLSWNAPATMCAAVPELAVFDLPYIFKDKEQAYRVLDGEIGAQVFAKGEASEGYYVLAVFEGGFRQTTNSVKPITCLADYDGLKMRTPESKVYLGLYEALGSIPTAMDYAELFTALQNGTVDGQEGALINIYTSKFYEVQKYLTIDNHIYAANPMLISKSTMDKLDPAIQQLLRETCMEARDWERSQIAEEEATMIETMQEAGMEITELSDEALTEIINAVKPMWEDFYDTIGKDLIDAVSNS